MEAMRTYTSKEIEELFGVPSESVRLYAEKNMISYKKGVHKYSVEVPEHEIAKVIEFNKPDSGVCFICVDKIADAIGITTQNLKELCVTGSVPCCVIEGTVLVEKKVADKLLTLKTNWDIKRDLGIEYEVLAHWADMRIIKPSVRGSKMMMYSDKKVAILRGVVEGTSPIPMLYTEFQIMERVKVNRAQFKALLSVLDIAPAVPLPKGEFFGERLYTREQMFKVVNAMDSGSIKLRKITVY